MGREVFPHWARNGLPFNMLRVEVWAEMRSTGEVLGLAGNYGLAFYKAQEGANALLPREGTVLITVAEHDRPGALEAARRFRDLGFSIRATAGTCAYLNAHDVAAEQVLKMHEGRPNVADSIKNGEISLILNTPAGRQSAHDDSYIRKAAIRYRIPYMTTTAAGIAAAKGIAAMKEGRSRCAA